MGFIIEVNLLKKLTQKTPSALPTRRRDYGNEDQLKLGAFVYVRLPTKCSHWHYVGKIILKDMDDGISVEFMRKNKE